MNIGIMEADIDSDVDATAIAETGTRNSDSYRWNVSFRCRYDKTRLKEFGTTDLDLWC